ncbi:uncharacterized protein LOC111363953, partial [Spodoptera litura]|uniref:Uncharacterized protein LOC111363953 n=1 Tax=Spodoptera litura TaxID=69820 RepID=A0A9J7J5P1_SPOLT
MAHNLMADNNTDFENILLQNALLFTAIRKHKTEEEKVKTVSKYLNQCADINSMDANDEFNTPLHVAVLKGEIEVVKFLVDKGASITLTNSNGHTAIDIATILKPSKSLAIAKYFRTLLKEQCANFHKQVYTPNDDTKSDAANKHTTMPLIYCKRSGTSALSGQRYETKLLSLILLRALHDNEITDFYLGVNLKMLPITLNGIYIKYKLKNCEKWKIILLQVQNKDDPSKDKVTVDSILKLKGDLSLYAYLAGYQNLWPKSLAENDYEIVAFTSAHENFYKKHTVNNTDSTRFLTTQQATYLTKTCKFYEEAGKDILETPLLSFLDTIYREKIKKERATFERDVVHSLVLSKFLQSGHLQLIYSNAIDFTCIKIFQYFNELNMNDRYFFIDLDFVILKNYFDDLKSELNETKMPLLIVVCQGNIGQEKLIEKLK